MKSLADTFAGGFSPHGRNPRRRSDSDRARDAYAILRESNPLLPPRPEDAELGALPPTPRQGRGGPHRNSQHSARWQPIPKQLWGRLMSLVEEFETETHLPGQQGALKQSGVSIFRAMLFGFLNPRSGQCDPSYEALAARTGLGRSTVHEALRRLEAFGLIERTRRVVPRQMHLNGRVIGTSWEQTSNAYRLGPPRRLSLFLQVAPKAAALWEQWLKAWNSMLTDVTDLLKSSESDNRIESTLSDYLEATRLPASPLDAALQRLGEGIRRTMEGIAPGDAYGEPPLAAHF